jgi:hypothetical protein
VRRPSCRSCSRSPGRSLWADARTRLARNRAAVASMAVLDPDRARLPLRPARDGAPLRSRLPGLCPRPGEPVAAAAARADRAGGAAHRGAHPRPRRRCPDRRRRPASHPRGAAPDRRAAARLLRSFRPVRPGAGPRSRRRRPAALDRGADRAPALPVRHRRQRARPPHAHARRRPRLARDRASRDSGRDRRSGCSTARSRAISAAASTSS